MANDMATKQNIDAIRQKLTKDWHTWVTKVDRASSTDEVLSVLDDQMVHVASRGSDKNALRLLVQYASLQEKIPFEDALTYQLFIYAKGGGTLRGLRRFMGRTTSIAGGGYTQYAVK